VAANKAPSMKEGFMNPNSIEFIYTAINAIASGKHNPETEQCLSDAIDEELLLINATSLWSGRMNLLCFRLKWRVTLPPDNVHVPDVRLGKKRPRTQETWQHKEEVYL
jgi:hypothetical protein